mgnify:CR=1 FL=1
MKIPLMVGRLIDGLNESPSEKEGKSPYDSRIVEAKIASMKVPPRRKGNDASWSASLSDGSASMKVPPQRKGNTGS